MINNCNIKVFILRNSKESFVSLLMIVLIRFTNIRFKVNGRFDVSGDIILRIMLPKVPKVPKVAN